jgi:predicted glycogen debranching enzyme
LEKLIRRIDLTSIRGEEARESLRREWLVTNGLGGYASGTISGRLERRYHGLLVAALPSPHGRILMLSQLAERVQIADGRWRQLGNPDGGQPEAPPAGDGLCLTEFRLENQLPVWRYELDGVIIEKDVLLLYGQNTCYITFRLLSKHESICLELRPLMNFREHELPVSHPLNGSYGVSMHGDRYEITTGWAELVLRLVLRGDVPTFINEGGVKREFFYEREAERGYEALGVLWSPGCFRVNLSPLQEATLIASTEPWNRMLALSAGEAVEFSHQRRQRLIRAAHPKARVSPAADLVLAADQFIINPVGRIKDAERAHATGDEVRTIIAGYHWFTDWGRDTMISLEGLTLVTGRQIEAGWILRTFAHYLRDGLIPNLFPEGGKEGLYHTADATLWYFHALDRYLHYTDDRQTLQGLLPALVDIAEHHLRGTRFGIRVDPADGLLAQGEAGYQLTWMDAKVHGWVVTPRRGKAVEINGLWYNALRLLAEWLRQERGDKAASPWDKHAARAKASFNRRFWHSNGGYLYDVVDGEHGDDPALRPNQVLAIALRHPVLDPERWKPVMDTVRERLATPLGLRSLDRQNENYKPQYFGDLRARDAAYHQGTVWAWLVGPFIDAWLKVYPDDRAGAQQWLEAFRSHLHQACVGSISEIFDAETPFTPRGCIAQAWSVAEVLRSWVNLAD